jgi:hypothetical protein
MQFKVGSILAGFCAVAGLLGTLVLLVVMMAGGANLSPAVAQVLACALGVVGLVGLLCLAGEAAANFVWNVVTGRR